jgi:Family of unknown function (DUF5519)
MRPGNRPISYADLVIDRFQNWPLTESRMRHPPGRALALHGLRVLHLHRDDLAEVFLTGPVIDRLDTALSASGRVDVFADTGWVQVHLDTEGDLFLLQSLVSLAIQANDPASHPVRPAVTDCPASRCHTAAAKAPAWAVTRVRRTRSLGSSAAVRTNRRRPEPSSAVGMS